MNKNMVWAVIESMQDSILENIGIDGYDGIFFDELPEEIQDKVWDSAETIVEEN